MTAEQFAKGKEILDRIKGLTNERRKWEESINIRSLRLESEGGISNVEYIRFINFDELKAVAILKITKEIEKLQKEFENL